MSFFGTFDFSRHAGLLYAIINCNITQLEVYKMQLSYIPKSVCEVLCFFHSSQKSAQLCLEKKNKIEETKHFFGKQTCNYHSCTCGQEPRGHLGHLGASINYVDKRRGGGHTQITTISSYK